MFDLEGAWEEETWWWRNGDPEYPLGKEEAGGLGQEGVGDQKDGWQNGGRIVSTGCRYKYSAAVGLW